MKIIKYIDKISEWSGIIIAWLVVPLAVVVFYEVVLRYIFNAPTGWAYDTAWMLYSTLFIIGGAYTLKYKRHVRIDVIYQRFLTIRGKAIFDLVFYVVVFLPVTTLFTVKAFQFALRAWMVGEKLSTTVWFFPAGPIKTLIPIGFFLLCLQGMAEFIRCFTVLKKGEKL